MMEEGENCNYVHIRCISAFLLQNIELKVDVESLKKELVEKQELLKKAR